MEEQTRDKKVLYDLIEKAIAGDDEAFENLYRLYTKNILFHVRNLVKIEADVEDVAQEVVIQMYKSIGALKTPYAFSPWLRRVIVNVCHNYNRNHVVKKNRDFGLETAGELYEEDESHIPHANVESEDIRARFMQRISELPEMQRTALIMYYYDEMSYKDIAKSLGVAVSTISTNIRKAKQRLEMILENEKKQNGGKTLDYGALAVGPLIAETLSYGADKSASVVDLENFNSVTDGKIESYDGKRNIPMGWPAARIARWIKVGTGLAAAVVIVVVVTFFVPLPQTDTYTQNPGVVAAEASAYIPNAKIDFTLADDGEGSVNPSAAKIVINDNEGKVVGWTLTDAAGNQITSGASAQTEVERDTLPPGEYLIKWNLKSDSGKEATVKRTFFIE